MAQHNDYTPSKRQMTAVSLVADSIMVKDSQETRNNGDMILDSNLPVPDSDFSNLGTELLDLDLEVVDFLNLQTNDENLQHLSSESFSPFSHSTCSTDQKIQVDQAISIPKISIPPLPTTYSLRSMIQRPKMKSGLQRIANLMLHTLKSYPRMILHHNTLPPYIHPGFLSLNFEYLGMESLTNCISLVYMINRVQGSRKLFWKNVRMECERLCEEYLVLNKWELLAALHALAVYILIRLDEGETEHNNLDFLLLATTTVMAKQQTYGGVTDDTHYGLEATWKDWIFEESRRRLAVIYRVVNMLIYFEPAALCDLQPDLVLAPLPAKKLLWEASDEFTWQAERQRKPVQFTFGLAANGELVKLEEAYCSDALLIHKSLEYKFPSRSMANWEE